MKLDRIHKMVGIEKGKLGGIRGWDRKREERRGWIMSLFFDILFLFLLY